MERQLKKLSFFLAGLLLCHAAYSAELFGTVDGLSGKTQMVDKTGKVYIVALGQQIYEGYSVNTSDNGELHIVTADGGFIALRPNTSFRVDEYKANGGSSDKMFMSLVKGAMRSITGWIGKRNKSAYHITTPTATIAIHGTDHETIVIEKTSTTAADEPGTYDTVKDGSTLLKTPQGQAEVRPGKFVFAPKDRAVAPYQLSKPPKYFTTRVLKIESRIQQRKEYLRDHMDQIREERIKRWIQDGTLQPETDDNLADPTRPTTGREQEDKPKPVLHAVYLSPRRTSAIIDGQEVKLGEKFGEATLTKIKDTEVILTHPDGTIELIRMHPGIEKKMIDPRQTAKDLMRKEQSGQ